MCMCVCVSVYVCALQLSNIYLHTNFTLKSLRSLFYGRGKNQLTKDLGLYDPYEIFQYSPTELLMHSKNFAGMLLHPVVFLCEMKPGAEDCISSVSLTSLNCK